MSATPLILYVPGLLPKPEAGIHSDALFRCLLAGVRHVDAEAADEIERAERGFDMVSWTYDFYGEYRDFGIDAASVDAVIVQQRASEQDLQDATSRSRRTARWLFSLADLLPFLIPHVANERMQLHLRDLLRYTRNHNGIADHVRQMLKLPLRAAAGSGRPVLLLTHSMGSVIGYEALWQMSHEDGDDCTIDLFITMGSPLGQRFIQKRILGHAERSAYRYPHGVRRWINLSAVGDLTAIDPTLADDFAPMLRLGLVEGIEDRAIHNYFRLDGELNVHAEYGYLANAATGRIIAEWWRSQR
jgi:hypothetical protein